MIIVTKFVGWCVSSQHLEIIPNPLPKKEKDKLLVLIETNK